MGGALSSANLLLDFVSCCGLADLGQAVALGLVSLGLRGLFGLPLASLTITASHEASSHQSANDQHHKKRLN